jgi:hypothetical protein
MVGTSRGNLLGITEKMQGISKNEIACRSGYFVFQNAPWDFMLCKSTSKYTKNVG